MTVGCHHCGIAKPGSHASRRRSASTDTSHTSSTRATTRPPRTIRPLMCAASAASRPTNADTPATTSTSTVASSVATTGSAKIPPLTTPSTAYAIAHSRQPRAAAGTNRRHG